MYRSSRTRQLGLLLLLTCGIILVGGNTDVFAQQATGSASATATVLSQITVSSDQDLTFGNVIPGDSVEVLTTSDANSAIIRLTTAANAFVSVSLFLPGHLEEVGGDKLIVTFEATHGAYDTNVDPNPSDGTQTIFDPTTVLNQQASALGDLDVFLGGKIKARLNQTAGSYTGDIVLYAWYDGN